MSCQSEHNYKSDEQTVSEGFVRPERLHERLSSVVHSKSRHLHAHVNQVHNTVENVRLKLFLQIYKFTFPEKHDKERTVIMNFDSIERLAIRIQYSFSIQRNISIQRNHSTSLYKNSTEFQKRMIKTRFNFVSIAGNLELLHMFQIW